MYTHTTRCGRTDPPCQIYGSRIYENVRLIIWQFKIGKKRSARFDKFPTGNLLLLTAQYAEQRKERKKNNTPTDYKWYFKGDII